MSSVKDLRYFNEYIDLYCAQLALTSLGIATDQIFVGCVGTALGKNTVLLLIRSSATENVLIIQILPPEASQNEFISGWLEFAHAVNNRILSDEELHPLCKKSEFSTPEHILNISRLMTPITALHPNRINPKDLN